MIDRVLHSFKILLVLFSYLFLTSCVNPTEFKCIPADSFGNLKNFAINSSLKFINPGFGSNAYEIGQWYDTGELVSGINNLVVVVNNSDKSILSHWNNRFTQHTKGAGLYMLIADPKNPHPNKDYRSNLNPAQYEGNFVYSLHCDGSSCPSDKGEPAGGIIIASTEALAGKRIYFKILDADYSDNSGYYQVTIRSGLYKSANDPITKLVLLVKERVTRAMKRLYEGVINNIIFQGIVKVSLVGYIAFQCILFVMGLIRGSLGEFIIILSKLGIILTLISPTAYNQLYDLFVNVFIGGLEQLTAIVSGYSGNTAGGIFGDILQSVANDDIFNKLVGLVYANFGMGLLLFILYIIVLTVLACSVIYCAFLYILSIMSIAFMISIAPFIMPFILFKKTNEIYENYMKVLTSSMLQVVIVVSFYAFFRDVAMNYFQRNLGYRVCWETVVDLGILKFYNWKVNIENTVAKIDVPGNFINSDGKICQPYMCQAYRYVNLPYLVPAPDKVPEEANGGSFKNLTQEQMDDYFISSYENDQKLIDHFFEEHGPTTEEAGMLIAVVVLFFFTGFMISPIAKILSNMPFSWGSGGTALDQADGMANKIGGGVRDKLFNATLTTVQEGTKLGVKTATNVPKYTYRGAKALGQAIKKKIDESK